METALPRSARFICGGDDWVRLGDKCCSRQLFRLGLFMTSVAGLQAGRSSVKK